MSYWSELIALVNSSKLVVFGDSATYWRNASSTSDAVAPYPITGILESGKFADPNSAIYGGFTTTVAQIVGGPMKGDFLSVGGLNLVVQEIYRDDTDSWVDLRVRKARQ